MISTELGVWIAAIGTLAIFSYPFKENVIYRIFEHTMVGLALAYFWVTSIRAIIDLGVRPILMGNVFHIISLVLGIMFLLSLSNKYKGLSRWPLALLIGVNVAVVGRGALETMFVEQILATSINLGTFQDIINSIIMLCFTLFAFSYFYFSREMKGPLKTVNLIGRYAFLTAFGVAFGGTVLSRMGLLIGRLNFLVKVWLGL